MKPKHISRKAFLSVGAAGVALGTVGIREATSGNSVTEAGSETWSSSAVPRAGARVREYWVQAESFRHNLVPTGKDQMMGKTFRAYQSSYWALGFRAYTPNWEKPLAGGHDIGPNSGIPGPIIRAHVGDVVKVHFKNNDSHYKWPHSMHPHGFKYVPDSDGGFVAAQNVPGRAVPFGHTYTYTWIARPDSVGTWPYHDHSLAQGLEPSADSLMNMGGMKMKGMNMGPMGAENGDSPIMEYNAELGMLGMIAITDHKTPKVDREIFLFFHDMYAAEVPGLAQDFDCFNGHSYLGNTPTFRATVGDRVRWRIAALGREFHVFHLHGHRWKNDAGSFVDSQVLGPSTSFTIEYTEDNPGDWLYHCHVVDHMMGGMVGWYKVST